MSKPPITDLALAEGLYRMRLERIPVQASVNEALKKLLYQFKANRYTHPLLREVIEGVDKWIVMYSKATALLFTIYPSLRWEYKPFTTYDKLQLEVDNLYVTNQWPGSIRKKLDEEVKELEEELIIYCKENKVTVESVTNGQYNVKPTTGRRLKKK